MRDHQLIATGFFQKHHKDVRQSMDDVSLKNFTNLDEDVSRVSYVQSIPKIKEFNPTLSVNRNLAVSTEKHTEKARDLKTNGNSAVKIGDWRSALDLYTKSYLFMPKENEYELSIILANRSAALYHLKNYELALIDIKSSLQLGYPKDLKYKVLDRMARCYLALKWNEEAVDAFKLTVSALDDSSQSKDKSLKMQMDAQLMIEILNKGINMSNKKGKDVHSLSKMDAQLPLVYENSNDVYKSTTCALDIESNDSEGRFAVAKKDIKVGEYIVVEKPHCSVLLSEFASTHCHHCFKKCIAAQICPNCTNAIFCSAECKNVAVNSYHKYECPIMLMIWESGCSITCHMALRIIAQRDLSYFINIKSKLNEPITGKYLSDDYRRVYNLVRHESLRSKADYLQRTHMAVFLLNLLKSTTYFDSIDVDEVRLEVEAYIGSLILRNLQILQFNAHEIFELECDRPKSENQTLRLDEGKSVFLGGGLYPTLALFNHSCDPSVVRYFQGTSVIVRSIKNIKANEQISENYGPIFTRKPRKDRIAELKDQYWFDCRCIACEQDWPEYDKLESGIMRFKCDAGNDCKNVIPVPINCNEFLIKCGLCDQFTNILKGLKALQDTEKAQKVGKDYLERGDYVNAYTKFVDELTMYDETLAPPFKDYHMCQQNIRRCMLTFGNVNLK